ncbi:MAG: RNA-binding protein [Alphaproteobacteria bacterium HGW-Alphaproteobacteria-3]|nr:MAG: RNA-binding protein [Alphaproteobacteria bacterium HGW-Alphaproteobacteria-3]
MPKGPKGEKRPADVIGNAVKIMKIATGEIEEADATPARGSEGGKARARKLSASEKRAIASKGASARWKKDQTAQGAKVRS